MAFLPLPICFSIFQFCLGTNSASSQTGQCSINVTHSRNIVGRPPDFFSHLPLKEYTHVWKIWSACLYIHTVWRSFFRALLFCLWIVISIYMFKHPLAQVFIASSISEDMISEADPYCLKIRSCIIWFKLFLLQYCFQEHPYTPFYSSSAKHTARIASSIS